MKESIAEQPMTVAQMIEALQKAPQDAVIRFALRVPTRAYPACYVMAPKSDYKKRGYNWWWETSGDCLTMIISLPEGFQIHERKK